MQEINSNILFNFSLRKTLLTEIYDLENSDYLVISSNLMNEKIHDGIIRQNLESFKLHQNDLSGPTWLVDRKIVHDFIGGCN